MAQNHLGDGTLNVPPLHREMLAKTRYLLSLQSGHVASADKTSAASADKTSATSTSVVSAAKTTVVLSADTLDVLPADATADVLSAVKWGRRRRESFGKRLWESGPPKRWAAQFCATHRQNQFKMSHEVQLMTENKFQEPYRAR